jgi:hypothetical protein
MVMDIFQTGDPRDHYDAVKWDFDDSNLHKAVGSDGYVYKLIRPNQEKLETLENIRIIANDIAAYFIENLSMYPKEVRDGLVLFAQVHGEYPTVPDNSSELYDLMWRHWTLSGGVSSRVTYNEIPKGTHFRGLNKPMERYLSHEPEIGKDKNLRSAFRQIYFDLGTKDLKGLVIHELSHTAANHQRWRMDDHGRDFKMYEKLIKDAWNIVQK